jgi:phytoene synthase
MVSSAVTFDAVTVAPLPRLLAAYAGKEATRHRLIWAFDARLADIVRTTREPLIGQMRLTWWHDVVTDQAGVKGRGDPLVDALRQAGVTAAPAALLALIEGWEALLETASPHDDALTDFAGGRGGGLFRSLAGVNDGGPDWLNAAGIVWALWDLSGHIMDEETARRAIALARTRLDAVSGYRWPRNWKPLRIAFGLARHDVITGRRAPAILSPVLYARVLRLALIGH